MERTSEEVLGAIDVLIDTINYSSFFANHCLLEYMSPEQVEKLSLKTTLFTYLAVFATYNGITSKTVDHIKKSTKSKEVCVNILCNTSIPLEKRKEFLTKQVINEILRTAEHKNNRYYWTNRGRASVDYSVLVEKLPEDILKYINEMKDVQDIII